MSEARHEDITFADAIAVLERALKFGIHPSLSGITALTSVMGRPQDAFRSVQVTGTNGKGSVTRMTAALLAAHGARTGAYTSPHLHSYAERIAIDGVPITERDFARAIAAASEAAAEVAAMQADALGTESAPDLPTDAYTEFELLTAAALWAFREYGVERAVLEVGMGGRWDATSIVTPDVAVVVGVDLDHTERLGDTRERIAWDKAHIIKRGSVAVMGPGCGGVEQVILARAAEMGAPVVRVGAADGDVTFSAPKIASDVRGPLVRFAVDGRFARYDDLEVRAPSFMVGNAAVAIAAAEAAIGGALDAEVARRALSGMVFPGRFELLASDPVVLVDGAHNPSAAKALARALGETFGAAKPLAVLVVLSDKDAAGIVEALAPAVGGFICTKCESPRSLDPSALAAVVAQVTGLLPETAPDLNAALEMAASRAGEGVVVTGSLYGVAEARELLLRPRSDDQA